MKRAILIFGASLALIGLAVLVWQPDRVKTAAARMLIDRAETRLPVSIEVRRVSGHLFTTLVFHDVHLRASGSEKDFLTIRELRVTLRWLALARGRVDIRSIRLVEPDLRLVKEADGAWTGLPVFPGGSGKANVVLDRISVESGRVSVENRSVSPPAVIVLEKLDAELQRDAPAWTVKSLSAEIDHGTVRASGSARPGPAPAIKAEVETRDLSLQRLLSVVAVLPAPLRLIHTGRSSLAWENRHLNFQTKGTLNGSSVEARGSWTADGPYEVSLQGSGLSVSRFWSGIRLDHPLLISMRGRASAPSLKSPNVNADASFSMELRKSERQRLRLAGGSIRLKDGRGPVAWTLEAEGLAAQFTGRIDGPANTFDSDFKAELSSAPAMADWIGLPAELDGRARVSGAVHHNRQGWRTEFSVHSEALAWKTLRLSSASASGTWSSHRDLPLEAVVHLSGFQPGAETRPWDVLAATVALRGKKDRWNADLNGDFRNAASMTWAGTLRHKSPGWEAAWRQWELRQPDESVWKADPDGFLRQTPGSMAASLDWRNGSQEIHLSSVSYRSRRWAVRATAAGVDLAPWQAWQVQPFPLHGRLDASASLSGVWPRWTGELDVDISSGSVAGWDFKDFAARSVWEPPWVRVTAVRLRGYQPGESAEADGRVPMDWGGESTAAPGTPMEFNIRAPGLDPVVFEQWVPWLDFEPGGRVSLQLKLQGRWPAIAAQGTLSGHAPVVRFPPVSLELKDLTAGVAFHGNEIAIQYMEGKTPKGSVRLEGSGRWDNWHFHLLGSNVPMKRPDLFEAQGDFNIYIDGHALSPDIHGKVHIQKGTYFAGPKKSLFAKRKKPEKPSEPRAPSPVWLATRLDLKGDWTRNVWFRDDLTKIETKGSLNVRKEAGQPSPTMLGSIEVVRGNYTHYGRDFSLEKGDLRFMGRSPINPLLNVEAVYRAESATVYLTVSGTAREPAISMRSNPPLPDDEVLSVLVFGSPLSELRARRDAGATDQEMAQVAGGVVGGYLTQELRRAGMDFAGLDVVRVEPTAKGSKLTLGRYIGRDLFVSLGQGLGEEARNLLHAEYFLTPRWTLVGETGSPETDHVDLQFRYPLKFPWSD